jgi:hypothetical protein
MYCSVLLYVCQTWLVTCEIQRKLQSFVNRCLRYIMKIRWPRVISNDKLWEMTVQININKEIKHKFGWIGHTLRKDDSEPCKAALQWNPQGTRGRGRPRNSRRQTTLNGSGKHSWSDFRFIARSRKCRRRFVDNLCSWWNYGNYYYHHHHFLSQVFFLPWYFSSWASGEPHHSVFKSQLVALSLWCAMFLVWQFL